MWGGESERGTRQPLIPDTLQEAGPVQDLPVVQPTEHAGYPFKSAVFLTLQNHDCPAPQLVHK